MENLDRHNDHLIGTDDTGGTARATAAPTLAAAQFDSGLVFLHGHIRDLTRYLTDLNDARGHLGAVLRTADPHSTTYRRARQCAILCIVATCRGTGTFRRLAADLDGLGQPPPGDEDAWLQCTFAGLEAINVYLQTAIGELADACDLITTELRTP